MPSKEIYHIVIKDLKYISINDKEYHNESVSARDYQTQETPSR